MRTKLTRRLQWYQETPRRIASTLTSTLCKLPLVQRWRVLSVKPANPMKLIAQIISPDTFVDVPDKAPDVLVVEAPAPAEEPPARIPCGCALEKINSELTISK